MKKKSYLLRILLFILALFVGCQWKEASRVYEDEKELLNQFRINKKVFDSVPLDDVASFLQSEINKQSNESWVIKIRRDKGDMRSFSEYEIENVYRFSATFDGEVGVGSILQWYSHSKQIRYEVNGNEILISKWVSGLN